MRKIIACLLLAAMLLLAVACDFSPADSVPSGNPAGSSLEAKDKKQDNLSDQPGDSDQPDDPNHPTHGDPAIPDDPQTAPKSRALNGVSYDMTGTGKNFYDAAYFEKLSAFSARLYQMSVEEAEEGKNFAVSPLSVYMALAILYAVADDGVKADIEKLTGMDADDLAKTGALFVSLVRELTFEGDSTILDLTNSIWLNTGLDANQDVLDMLAKELYCYAYEAPFAEDNAAANAALRAFIKEKTKDLIDQDFELDPETLFALVNTLYFKDGWSTEVEYGTEQRTFHAASGDIDCEFLIGAYMRGEVGETKCCYFFYETTRGNYRAKLILPKEGYTLADAMSPENLALVNAYTDYEKSCSDHMRHLTRCIFPSFSAEGELALEEVFARHGYLMHAFTGYTSELVDTVLAVSRITHKAVVNVDREGIEGAAVTIIANKATSTGTPTCYHDFVLDSAFGYLITDQNGIVLFAGQVECP